MKNDDEIMITITQYCQYIVLGHTILVNICELCLAATFGVRMDKRSPEAVVKLRTFIPGITFLI